MFLRIFLNKLGLARSEPSRWDLSERLKVQRDRLEENTGNMQPVSFPGPMIRLHKLNKKEIAINTGQIQSIEEMGRNSLIIFSSSNRQVVLESIHEVHRLIDEQRNKQSVNEKQKGE